MTSIREVYNAPDMAAANVEWTDVWHNFSTYEKAIASTDGLADVPAAELAARLDGFPPDSGYSRPVEAAAMLLGCLSARQLLTIFGEEVTAWTIGNDPNTRRVEGLTSALEDEGYNEWFLRKSRIVARENAHRQTQHAGESDKKVSGRAVLAQNTVMEAVWGSVLTDIDVPEIVRQSPKDDIQLSGKRCQEYAVVPVQADDGPDFMMNGRILEWVDSVTAKNSIADYTGTYLDTPTGFALTYRGLPQAIGGIVAAGNGQEVQLRQMQRIQGQVWRPSGNGGRESVGHKQPRGLMPIDWQKVLVLMAGGIARSCGMKAVAIREAVHGYNCYITKEQSKRGYTVPAQRLGFTRGEEGDWHMPLAHLISF